MTDSQRLTVRASEIRSKLLDLSRKDTITADDKTAISNLETQLGDTETQLRAAIKAESTETRSADGGENRAMARLVDRSSLGAIFSAVLEHRQTVGPEAEIQAHFKIGSTHIPLALLESRAVTTVPADSSHTPAETNQASILQPVFALGDSAFLGIPQPRVAAGSASFPVLTTRPDVGGPTLGSTSHDETDGSFSASLLEPGRLSASFSFRRTDAAKFPMMDEALRLALQSGLSEKMDSQMVAQIVSDVSRTSSSSVATHTTYLSRLAYGLVDGRYVSGESELRVLLGTETLVSMAALYRNTSSGEREAEDRESPGLLVGTLLTYGEVSPSHRERFREGSPSWPETGVVLNVQHDRKKPLLRFIPTVEGRELRVSAPFLNTREGRDAALMVREGVFTGLSVEFAADQDVIQGGLREIIKGRLLGAGLVDSPSYEASTVNVRARSSGGMIWRPYW